MPLRTVVSMTVRNDELDEARQLLGPFGPVEVCRSNAPDATTEVVASLSGDVREWVEERLNELTDRPYRVVVVERP